MSATCFREREKRIPCLKHAVEKMHCKTASTASIILSYCGYQNNSHRRDRCLLRQELLKSLTYNLLHHTLTVIIKATCVPAILRNIDQVLIAFFFNMINISQSPTGNRKSSWAAQIVHLLFFIAVLIIFQTQIKITGNLLSIFLI